MLVTHDLDTLAGMATRVAVLAEQRILALWHDRRDHRESITRSSAISSLRARAASAAEQDI
jgi:ABC-type nitrate/sulfonate/bicarbonate transport system ATPase subunit